MSVSIVENIQRAEISQRCSINQWRTVAGTKLYFTLMFIGKTGKGRQFSTLMKRFISSYSVRQVASSTVSFFFFSKTTMKQSYVGFPIKRKKKKRKVTCIRIFTLCCILAQFPYMAQCKRRRSPPWSLQDGGPNPWPIFMQTSYNCEENKKTKQSERSVLTSFIN